MPALKDVLTKGLPEGYVPVENAPTAPPATSPVDDAQFSSSMVRCPLPPTNADADSLRTFQKGSSTPQFRVMPLPPQTGGTAEVTTGGASTSSSSSSSSSGSSTSAVPMTAAVTVSVPANDAVLTRVTASRSFQLFSVGTTAPCNVRLYGTQGAQSSDVSRQVDAPVPAELTQNILLDVVFDTTPYSWNTQNIVGVNGDSPQSTNLYVSVFNPNPTPLSNVSIYVTYFPLES
jgi:hypothetical protein